MQIYGATSIQERAIRHELGLLKQNPLGKILSENIDVFDIYVSDQFHKKTGLAGQVRGKRIYLDSKKCFQNGKFSSLGKFILRHELGHTKQTIPQITQKRSFDDNMKSLILSEVGANLWAFFSYPSSKEDMSDLKEVLNQGIFTMASKQEKDIPFSVFSSLESIEKTLELPQFQSFLKRFFEKQINQLGMRTGKDGKIKKGFIDKYIETYDHIGMEDVDKEDLDEFSVSAFSFLGGGLSFVDKDFLKKELNWIEKVDTSYLLKLMNFSLSVQDPSLPSLIRSLEKRKAFEGVQESIFNRFNPNWNKSNPRG
ncbi:MAG: hypothetical protein JXR30_00080 [Alphaproteobacteria bacterium]|nr:hypothetical protein [Alphaproteobacteria bacterium]